MVAMKDALIGEKLGHSISPQVHQIIFKELGLNNSYELIELEPDQVADFLATAGKEYTGLNVTIPYKMTVMDAKARGLPLEEIREEIEGLLEDYDESKIIDETFTMVVQVNGKVRGKIEVNANTSDDEMKELAKSIENVKNYIDGKEIVKEVIVPKKLVSIVVK